MKTVKKIVLVLLVAGVLIGGYKIYEVRFNHRFEEIAEGKFYKSGVIPPDQIQEYVRKYHLKSIVDFRGATSKDKVNNPEDQAQIDAEKAAAAAIPGLHYYNIPSDQVPGKQNLDSFYKVIDDPKNYPILVHCYHGIGRAQVYSAVYRIEKEAFSNEAARQNAAFPVIFSSFDNGTPKGEFLKSYVARKDSLKLK